MMVQTAFRSAFCCLILAAAVSGCGKPPEKAKSEPVVRAAPKPPAVLPARTPGLWETTVSEVGSEEIQTLRLCIDALTDARLGVLGTDFSATRCGPKTVSQLTPDSWGVLVGCKIPSGGTEEYSGSVTGDFAKAYTMKLRVQTTGSPMPQMNRIVNYAVESKRLGECGKDQKPGDVIDDGVTVNLFEIEGAN